MFTHVKLNHEYSLSALPNTTATQNLKMDDYTDDTVSVTDYLISQTSTETEQLFVYDTGFVFYWKVSAGKAVIRTNGIFKPGEDGNLHLVKLDPDSKI